MKCHIYFSGKNRKNIAKCFFSFPSMLSINLPQRLVLLSNQIPIKNVVGVAELTFR